MSLKKINIGGVDYEVAGASSGGIIISLAAVVSYNYKSYLKVPTGSILPTDTIKIYRNVTTKSRTNSNNLRSSGWRTVSPKDTFHPHFNFTLQFYKTEDGFDYWWIKYYDDDMTSYNQTVVDFNNTCTQSGDPSRGAPMLRQRCGIVVYRDGKAISDYIKFGVNRADRSPSYFAVVNYR